MQWFVVLLYFFLWKKVSTLELFMNWLTFTSYNNWRNYDHYLCESIAQIMHELQQKVTQMHNLLVRAIILWFMGGSTIYNVDSFVCIDHSMHKKTETLITCYCAVSLYSGIFYMHNLELISVLVWLLPCYFHFLSMSFDCEL